MATPLLHEQHRTISGVDPANAVQVLPPDAPRHEWLAMRRTGIGSSDVSVLVGLNDHSSRYELWLDKTGQLPLVDEWPSEEAEMGTLLEPVVRDRFARLHQLAVRPAGTLRSARWPWMLANPDGLCSDGAGYEGKTCSVWATHDWDDGQVPDHAELQAQWCMAVTGLDRWHVAVLIGGQRNHYRLVRRDEELIGQLVTISRDFWQHHVLEGIAPELDGSPAATRYLNDRYPTGNDDIADVDRDTADELIRQKTKTAQAVKDAEADHEHLKNRVKNAMGEAGRLMCGEEEIATWRNTGRFNEARFRRDQPDLAADYTKTISVVDVDRLAADHPELYRAYRARVLRFSK